MKTVSNKFIQEIINIIKKYNISENEILEFLNEVLRVGKMIDNKEVKPPPPPEKRIIKENLQFPNKNN